MRYFILIITLFIGCSFFVKADTAPATEIIEIKKAVIKAVESSRITDSLYNKLHSQKGDNAMITAYVGLLEALKAKHAWNPYYKMKYVAMANSTMKEAVEASSQNMEIRFMRFSIQHYTPAFLGYSKNLDEDRKALVSHYRNKTLGNDTMLIKSIAKFIIDSKRCTPAEVSVLKKFM
ncbi:MAG: hypothetical protein JWN56_643 [Sphingobacteriales bacterium]|nr:hypothetical protein [Sphingobacteriales bacterium]